jgi:hypothetical protein
MASGVHNHSRSPVPRIPPESSAPCAVAVLIVEPGSPPRTRANRAKPGTPLCAATPATLTSMRWGRSWSARGPGPAGSSRGATTPPAGRAPSASGPAPSEQVSRAISLLAVPCQGGPRAARRQQRHRRPGALPEHALAVSPQAAGFPADRCSQPCSPVRATTRNVPATTNGPKVIFSCVIDHECDLGFCVSDSVFGAC